MLFFLTVFSCGSRTGVADRKSMEDPSYIAVKVEFEAENYDRVLKLADSYYRSTNEKTKIPGPLFLKGRALEKIVEAPEGYDPADYIKYGLSLQGDRYVYDGRDYRKVFEEYNGSGFAQESYRRFLDLNHPFQSKNFSDDKQIRFYLKLLDKYFWKNPYAEKFLGKDQKEDIISSYLDSWVQLAGFLNKEQDLNKRFFSDLIKACRTVRSNSKNRDTVLRSHFAEFYILLQSGDDFSLQEKINRIIALYPGEKPSAYIWYLQANHFYIEEKKQEALKSFRRAYSVAKGSGLTDEDLNKYFLYDCSGVHSFLRDIRRKTELIETEEQYRKMLNRHDIAVVTGNNVRLRETRDVDDKRNIITSLNTGDRVICLQRSEEKEDLGGYKDYWYFVRARNGSEGWLFGKYLLFF